MYSTIIMIMSQNQSDNSCIKNLLLLSKTPARSNINQKFIDNRTMGATQRFHIYQNHVQMSKTPGGQNLPQADNISTRVFNHLASQLLCSLS